MLSSVTGFFFGSSAPEETVNAVDLKTKESQEGWVIVDVNESGQEEEVEPIATRTRQQTLEAEPVQQVVVARRHQPQLVAPSSGLNVQVDRVRGVRQNQRKSSRKFNRSHLERSNKCREFQSCGKKQRQRSKMLCKSGALNARYGQR